jgi:hydroxypyruvate isomerase
LPFFNRPSVRFAANISILFQEHAYLDRFAAARAAGFDTVESWWPQGADPSDVAAAITDANLDVALLNMGAGDMAAGDRGLLADPARERELAVNIPIAIELARRVGAPRLNALVGLASPDMDRVDQLALARDNLRRIARAAEPHGIEVMIEAINTIENGPYLIATTAQAEQLRAAVDRPNVRLQYDVDHMQRMEGNLISTIDRHFRHIAHIQIADSPFRQQPGTGEIAYGYVLGHLERLGYTGYVGLEYKAPDGDTLRSLDWLAPARRAARAG